MTDTQVLIHQVGALSYFGIFILSLMANVVIPIPEEIVLLAIGFVAGTGRINPYIVIPIVITGLLTSDITIFVLSKRGNKVVNFFYNKFFAKRLADRREWLETHIEKVIFFARFLVQLRFLGPFIAGQSKVSWKKFLTYEMAALIIYVPFLIWAGGYFQDRIEDIGEGVKQARNILFLVIGIIMLIGISKFIKDITFGGYILSLEGEAHEKTWIPHIYKKKK